ncbi:DUF624 domain-containing protein [Schleiferilactobacillus shenzhenensis]|uniref:DUF624 domain-containing protein n=1 Tax=Schleiferilactobacillus shenzhenensis LY-73 TaxID=1231336 RepID=U4TIX5_9LACO|nr:DUF624 domain-containing protein [Schleiferilactobacillus shenzhenensis]ERL64771.1 hypothetical protein L248_0548 [Schleiferilactobacillus shenzhenensis LY-73]
MNNNILSSKLMVIVDGIWKIVLSQLLLVITNPLLAFSVTFVPVTASNVVILIFLSVTLLPSLSALYGAFAHSDGDWQTLWHEFFRRYRRDWRETWRVGVAFTLALALLVYDWLFIALNPRYTGFLFLLLPVLSVVFLMLFYTAYMIAGFQGSVRNHLHNALYLTFHHVFSNILFLAVVIGLVLITKATNFPVLQLVTAGLIGWFSYLRLSRLVTKAQQAQS